MKTAVYNLEGKKVGDLDLPQSVFGLKWNHDLVHRVLESMRSRRRKGTAHAKGRGEVSGGGKKPWRQKGTGRARHGSIRSPIWVGGGVSHGPLKDKVFSKKLNKKAKRKALLTVLSQKMADGEILVADEVILNEPKTKKAQEAMKNLSKIKGFETLAKKGVRVAISPKDKKTSLAFRNISGVEVIEPRNLNTFEALSVKYLILGEKDIAGLTKEK